jgi:N-methylhydantoinase A
MKLSNFAPDIIKDLLAELQAEATSFVRDCDPDSDILSEFKTYMRYTGQGWEIPIALSAAQVMAPDAGTFLELFEADYSALFGRTVDGMDVEITVWSVNATTPTEKVAQIALAKDAGAAKVSGKRALFDPALAKVTDAQVVLRDNMKAGQTVQGPAVVTEDETTIIVPTSRQVTAQPDGTIDMTTTGDRA